jgi:hypothetical protein
MTRFGAITNRMSPCPVDSNNDSSVIDDIPIEEAVTIEETESGDNNSDSVQDASGSQHVASVCLLK